MGRITSVDIQGQSVLRRDQNVITRFEKSATFLADRCYKGEASSSLRIEFVVEEPALTFTGVTVAKGEYLLAFLKEKSSSIFEFADPFWGKFPTAPVVSGLLRGTGEEQLQVDMAILLDEAHSPTEALAAISVLQGCARVSELSRAVLERRIIDSDPEVAFAALGVLLKTLEPRYIALFADRLRALDSHPLPDRVLRTLPALAELLEEVADPQALAYLDDLVESPFTLVKISAITGMRHLRDPASVPFLIKRLDDPDPTVKYIAFMALADVTGKRELVTGMAVFEANPKKHTDMWKAWWHSAESNMYRRER